MCTSLSQHCQLPSLLSRRCHYHCSHNAAQCSFSLSQRCGLFSLSQRCAHRRLTAVGFLLCSINKFGDNMYKISSSVNVAKREFMPAIAFPRPCPLAIDSEPIGLLEIHLKLYMLTVRVDQSLYREIYVDIQRCIFLSTVLKAMVTLCCMHVVRSG